jgi:hypothetical protein
MAEPNLNVTITNGLTYTTAGHAEISFYCQFHLQIRQ